jgi:hypothetical protein
LCVCVFIGKTFLLGDARNKKLQSHSAALLSQSPESFAARSLHCELLNSLVQCSVCE